MSDPTYRVLFRDPEDGEVVALVARSVTDSALGLGFVCVSDFDFAQRGAIVDPKQERLQRRFEDVRRMHLHLYAILAIEELGDKPGELAFEHDRSKVIVLRAPEDEG